MFFPLAAIQNWQQVGCLLPVESHAKTVEMNIQMSTFILLIYYFVRNFICINIKKRFSVYNTQSDISTHILYNVTLSSNLIKGRVGDLV